MKKVAIMRGDLPFPTAFAAARQAGAELFDWRGSRFHTRRADDAPTQPDPEPIVRWETTP